MLPRTATTLLCALALSVAAALPAASSADEATGGTAAPDGQSTTGATGPGTAPATAANGTLKAGRGALLGRWQKVSGALDGTSSGRKLLVQIQRGSDSEWITVARATTGKQGRFSSRWRPEQIGRFTLRVVPAAGTATASAASDTHPTTPTTVYHAAIATQYGRGFYGSRTACGTILRPATIGVAHRTLPCGTMVEFYFRGATVRAPVIDRGPYANNADWDLTDAAARKLKFTGLDYVGAIRVGRVKLARG
jgi:hypothetical protein